VVLPFLTNQVHDTNADTRYRIIESIHDYGKNALLALPTLVDSLQDPSESVRDAATNAIFEIAQDVLPAGARPRTRYTDIAIPKPRHPR
jgi:HEAT repeat protein